MKLDYEYIKQILHLMEEEPSHRISNYALLAKVNNISVPNNDYVRMKVDDAMVDKFIGHIRQMHEAGLIGFEKDMGFSYGVNANIMGWQVYYFITPAGYSFLSALNDNSFFNKVKEFTLSAAIGAATNLLTEGTTKLIKKAAGVE